jgi:hypothetical protein
MMTSYDMASTIHQSLDAGGLLYAFENELTAMGAYGQSLEVPVTPVRCCKACVNPNARPAMDDCAAVSFCHGEAVQAETRLTPV